MSTAAGNGGENHAIEIAAAEPIDRDWLDSMEAKMKGADPTLLKTSAGRESCCIFRIPQTLIEINPKAYHPTTVSIGPYHHGKPHLETIQQHKWRFLAAIVDRMQIHGGINCLSQLFSAVAEVEDEIRDSYSESTANFGSREFVEMIVLDGCFIIELFSIVGGVIGMEPDDPIFNLSCILSFLMRDLLRLENQIPIFVLKSLYRIASPVKEGAGAPSLTKLALNFFDHGFERTDDVLSNYMDDEGKHLLDLFRLTFIPKNRDEGSRNNSEFLHLPQSVRKLRLAGVRFRPRPESDTILDIRFSRGILEIPLLTIDDFTSYALMNLVAFEQCYAHCSNHITIYTAFMGSLINNVEDAEYLSNRKILENCLGTDEEVTRLFNELGKEVATDLQTAYLGEMVEEVNRYCVDRWNIGWSEFKLTYFASPWSFVSASAVGLALLLTFLQTFFTVYAYYRPSG
ncbi:UPF0481 protein At3g47200 [Linum perenne]